MTVHIGVVGTGMIGRDHIRRLTDVVAGAEVVAVTDVDAELAREAAAGVGARALPTGQDVIDDPGVDAVVVTSWGPTHAEYVLAAIAAGKYVFCEKPLATTAADCLRIVEAEQASGRRLVQVGFMRRYDVGYQEMKQALSGLGPVLLMHCAHRNPSVPTEYHSDMAIQDTAVHEIDIIRWLLDEEIATAQVVVPKQTTRKFEHLRDPQVMLFDTESGVRIDLEVFVNCQYGYDVRHETVCEAGAVRLPDPGLLHSWKQRFGAAFDTEFTEWVSSVQAGNLVGPTAWDGYAVAVTSDATVEARRTGKTVSVRLKDRPAFYGS
ncbi:Gfo/Idh/MocA family oxidoreductase [Actinophytocola sp.]|uniref:Gfo/Idh/MocA family protein n=1 Tax=Actinophytocola sp. TaxID=1872138 RepID=UPI002ED3E5D7